MAFYKRYMMQNKEISKAWRAAHGIKVKPYEKINLPDICSEIGRYMRRDRHPGRRFSLRSMSFLLSGTTRLYNDEVDRLLKDTLNCSINPISARTVLTTTDQTMVHSGSPGKKSSEFVPEIDENNISVKGNSSEYESIEDNRITELPFLYNDDSTVFPVSSNSAEKTYTVQEKTEKTRDQIVQTTPTPESDFTGFDPNLPFGYVIVHDNYDSRIPTKILFTSLSANENFPPIRRPMN